MKIFSSTVIFALASKLQELTIAEGVKGILMHYIELHCVKCCCVELPLRSILIKLHYVELCDINFLASPSFIKLN